MAEPKAPPRDEVARQLLFQIHAVGHHHHAALLQRVVQQQRLGQEHHREALARAGGVPDHAAFAPAVGPVPADAGQQRPDAEELLVARDDLADLAVEQHEAAQEFQQPRRREQARPAGGPARWAASAATTATRSSRAALAGLPSNNAAARLRRQRCGS